MSKFLQGVSVSLMLVLLCLSLLIGGVYGLNPSSATTTGSRAAISDDEKGNASAVEAFITNWENIASYSHVYDWYGPYTTTSGIYIAAAGNGGTGSIAFHIGHGDNETYNNNKHWYILDDSGYHVYDSDIFPQTTKQETRFAFLWSCQQGDTIGGTYGSGQDIYGMPYAWLHTTSLSPDGYQSSDATDLCFIGWNGPRASVDLHIVGLGQFLYLLNVLLLQSSDFWLYRERCP